MTILCSLLLKESIMNSRKIVGVVSLIFAWIFIRISHEDEGESTHLPFILGLIDYILFAFGILQLVLAFMLEDLPQMKQKKVDRSEVSENRESDS